MLITGGAGFIGSNLCGEFIKRGRGVIAYDNLSQGSLDNLQECLNQPGFKFIQGDMLNPKEVEKAVNKADVVFHLAANPEVRLGSINTKIDYEQNILATYNLLEAMKKSDSCKKMIFASTSTIYGEANVIPTPENYGPLKPISLYGASKLACESMISGYRHMFGLRAIIVRLANIIGPSSHHGIIYDFVTKLRSNPNILEILGDGTQNKSYLWIGDCVNAFLMLNDKVTEDIAMYNVGSEDRIDVLSIARIIAKEMGLHGVKFRFNQTETGGRGWKGDVKDMLLDISKIKGLNWKPTYTSAEAVRLVARAMVNQRPSNKRIIS